MLNPQRLSLVVRVFFIFTGLIGTSEICFSVLDRRPEDFPFILAVSFIGNLWIIYELAVHYRLIEVEQFEINEQKPLVKPSIEAPLYEKLWYYAKVLCYLVWGFLVGFFIGS
jgi:hypothetical protein